MILNLRTINGALRRLTGYALYRQTGSELGHGYALHKYTNPDGSFDYDAYRRVQDAGNKRKVASASFVQPENIAFLADYIKDYMGTPLLGVCHGTRRGLEQQWLSKHLGCSVIGTEISETASQFPNTIQWDFHEIKPEWIDAVDFIYSNSLDHSYNPEKALNAWMSCLKPNGLCFVEHDASHGADSNNELDPFGADIASMPVLIALWARGRFSLVDIVPAPKRHGRHTYFLVLKRTIPVMPQRLNALSFYL